MYACECEGRTHERAQMMIKELLQPPLGREGGEGVEEGWRKGGKRI